ncbi:MAG: type II toxin-antitoxin system death-on-curing family toxin [Candidatus Kerfeldbacteria bacterium]|nr:type II toxin-antitoxin system death-on-curing family toxin [Candidatus Kerfeldbacteria bacterium]
MIYLDGDELLAIHIRLIQRTGGSQGVRDNHLLKSIFERPKMTFGGKDLYSDLWTKAAVYYEGFTKFHVFVDGNKRTAFIATIRFLELNGYMLEPSNAEAEKFTLDIIKKKLEVSVIAAWLKKHSRKVRK